MWNPTVALGTVTHEYIGYLLPHGALLLVLLGPARPHLGGPAAVARGHPLRRRGRHPLSLPGPHLRGPGRLVAALAFMLSPYFLQYAGRISVILLPWAGLPWMVAFAALALRRGGWRYPALFALVVAHGQRHQRQLDHLRRRGPGAVARSTPWRSSTRPPGAGPAGRPQDGRADPACAACGGSSGCRSRRPTASTSSSTPRPSRPPARPRTPRRSSGGSGYWYFYGGDRLGPVDPVRRALHPAALAARPLLPRPRPLLPVGRARAVAPPRLLRRPWWWSGWCSRSGPSPTLTPRRSAGCSSAS